MGAKGMALAETAPSPIAAANRIAVNVRIIHFLLGGGVLA
jgi:hypothetical protein